MCGRYTLTRLPKGPKAVKIPDLLPGFEFEPRYNIAPTNWNPVITQEEPDALSIFRWGLIPSWARDEKIGYRMINARAETLAEKASFRNLIPGKRCLVVADGFYEWKQLSPKKKQPYRICLEENQFLYFAGLYSFWRNDTGAWLPTYTIITTEPNALMADLHNRMPVILGERARQSWLNPTTETPEALSLLKPYPESEMFAYPVDPRVGNVRNDTPELIERYAAGE